MHLLSRRKGQWTASLIVLLVLVTPISVSQAITISATATGTLTSPVPAKEAPGLSGGNHRFQGDVDPANPSTWTFDFTPDSNFASLLGAGSLKSATLTFTLAPHQLSLAPGTADSTVPGEQVSHSISARTTVEVELLDVYSADDILEMFATTEGKIPVFYPSPGEISAVQLELITETPTQPRMRLFVLLGSLLALLGGVGSVVWRTRARRRRDHSASSASAPGDERMALIGKMASTVIHDVKNSFTAIRSCAEVIADSDMDPHDRKDFADLLVTEIERGVDMTQELLEFSRGQARSLNICPHSLPALLNSTLRLLHQSFAQRQLSIQTALHYTGEINVDGEKMQRVFLNIATNARDAMNAGDTLTIVSRTIENRVVLEFIDTGCGMSSDLQATIFDPLVTAGKPQGTGLGMTIVKDILDHHHADIEIESIEGQGTTIRILLPGLRRCV